MQKYKTIPAEFIALADGYNMRDSSGVGFARRVKVCELTGLSTQRVADWLRIGRDATGTSFNFTRLRVLLRVLGVLPAPENECERLHQAIVLGVAKEANVKEALGFTGTDKDGLIQRALSGQRDLSDANLKKLRPFLAKIAAEVSAAEAKWRQELVGVGFGLVGHAKAGAAGEAPKPEPDAQPSGDAAEQPAADAPVNLLVSAIAPILVGVYPLLVAFVKSGSDEDFRELRKRTAIPGASNAVFAVQGLLLPLCSKKARQISTNSHQ